MRAHLRTAMLEIPVPATACVRFDTCFFIVLLLAMFAQLLSCIGCRMFFSSYREIADVLDQLAHGSSSNWQTQNTLARALQVKLW